MSLRIKLYNTAQFLFSPFPLLATKINLLKKPLSSFKPCKQLFFCLQRWFGEVTLPELHKYQYQCTLIFSVIWLGMIRLKCDSFDTDMGIRWCTKKANRKTEIRFMLFTLLTLHPYMPSEWFLWLRASYDLLRLL